MWLSHRYLLRMNLRDLGLTASKAVFERFRDGMLKANVLVAGPAADLAARVRAAQAIAMLSDPVVLFADAPTDELRATILDGVARLFGTPAGCSRPPGATERDEPRDGGGGPPPLRHAATRQPTSRRRWASPARRSTGIYRTRNSETTCETY